ncbi:DnaJ domain-containing protein [Halosimplex halobium]|uniref:J domain-containing protein n=1 Tax=Halosimplex halobium TaxID=3396618 RepID=UPI003F5649CE
MSTFYDVLGVEQSASDSEIKDAFKEQIKHYHGDQSGREDSDSRVMDINTAREVLTENRSLYDSQGHEEFVKRHDVEIKCGWKDGSPVPESKASEENATDTTGEEEGSDDDEETSHDEDQPSNEDRSSDEWPSGEDIKDRTTIAEDEDDDDESEDIDDVEAPETLAPDVSRRRLIQAGVGGVTVIGGLSLVGPVLSFFGGGASASSSTELWSHEVSPGSDVSAIHHTGDRIITAAETGIIESLSLDGAEQWSTDTRDRVSDVVIDGESIYVAGRKTIYSLALDSGEQRWEASPALSESEFGITVWDRSPIVSGYDSDAETYRLIVLDEETGEPNHSHSPPVQIRESPVRAGSNLVVPGDYRTVFYENPVSESLTEVGRVNYDSSEEAVFRR